MPSNIAKVIEVAKQLTLEVLHSLRTRKDFTWENVSELIWEHNYRQDIDVERSVFDRLVNSVVEANATMVSPQIVKEKFLGILSVGLDGSLPDDVVSANVESFVKDLATYEATRTVDLPIVNLALGSLESFSFGSIEFRRITNQDAQSRWWREIENYHRGENSAELEVVSYARVECPGDVQNSITYANKVVDESLLILRGIAFPIVKHEIPQIGVLNDHSTLPYRPLRIGKPKQNHQLEFASESATKIGYGTRPYNLRDELLSSINPDSLSRFISFIDSKGFDSHEMMPKKLLGGIRWIGQATKPDALEARFAKLCFALETLIGGESKDQTLTSRGLTATLAERAAFIIEKPDSDRMSIDKAVKHYYSIRSTIVHGGLVDISDEDLESFAKLVRNIAWSLLAKLDQFSSVDDLAGWVIRQRYS